MFSFAVSSMSKPAPSSMSGAMVPRTVHVPSDASSTPAMILSMVDLPEPLVPTRPNASPRFTLKLMWFSARNSLNLSSWRASAMKYSLRELNCSEAMLKIMETSSTSMTVCASSGGMLGRVRIGFAIVCTDLPGD